MIHLFLSVNIELNGKTHQQRLFGFFLFKQITHQMSQSKKIPAPPLFPIHLFATRTSSRNYFTHYAPVLRFSINDLA